MKFVTILPLVGVLLGWSLNEISQYLKVRRDQKASLSRVINALIEFRYYISKRLDSFKAVCEAGRLSRQGQDILIDFVSDARFSSNVISDKIAKSCDLLQAIDPLIAHNVESTCDSMLSLCRVNHDKITSRDIDMKDVELEIRMLQTLLHCLDQHIKLLAKKYSFRFFLRYKKYIKRDVSSSDTMKQVFEIA